MIVSISAGIIAISSFLPQATLIVNATPGVEVQLVEQKESGEYVPASTFVKSFRPGTSPRKFHIRIFEDTKALCAQTVPSEGGGGANTLSVVYRSCALLKR